MVCPQWHLTEPTLLEMAAFEVITEEGNGQGRHILIYNRVQVGLRPAKVHENQTDRLMFSNHLARVFDPAVRQARS